MSNFLGRSIALLTLSIGVVTLADTLPAETASESDHSSWYPRTTTGEKGTVVIYAPQIESWADFEVITAWVAFNVSRTASDETFYGSLHFAALTDTDLLARHVLLHDIEVLDLEIKGIEPDSEEYQLAFEAFTSQSRKVPLDLVLEYLPQEIPIESVEGLNTNPPRIFVSTTPAVLLRIDSEPVWLPIADGDLQFVLNANWDVLRPGESGPLYLCYKNRWLTAEAIDGAWRWADAPPETLRNIPDGSSWQSARACLPPESGQLNSAGSAPKVFYTTDPAELLQLHGEPDWSPIGSSGVDYATNTRQELFRAGERVFLLLSGRWFTAEDIRGEWVFTSQLPDAFEQIPEQGAHPKSYIRASVPGTREAWEAALVASIPRTAEIVRGTEQELDLNVNYGGKPIFQPVDGTDIEMAINTSYQTFRYQGTYYVCHNAVWLTSPEADGPWVFADSLPEEFASIPPGSPAYNTTFVSPGQSDAETIQYSYTAGYENAYVSNDTLVYGTGFAVTAASMWLVYEAFDDDYWYGYPGFPYYPWPPTYGYGSWYDPDTGRYGETVVGYGPYGAARGTAVFNPETGVYARGQSVWDSDEYAGRSYGYNPNTNTSIASNRYMDFEDDEGWSNRVARRGDEWRYSESEWEDGEMRTEFESSRGTEGEVYRERDGDKITGEGTLTGEDRSVSFNSEFEDGQGTVSFKGSEGGSGTLDREIEDGEISGSGTFTRDGQTIESDTTRTAEGVKREFESSEGGQGTSLRRGSENAYAFETASGDVYAGRDGDVYQKSDDGWSKIENPRTGSHEPSTATTARSSARSSDGQRTDTQLESSRIGYEGAYGRDTRAAYGDYSRLEQDRQSRQRGYDRYSRYQAGARGGRQGGFGRRRR